jgi:hypothetical protein
MRQTCCNMLVRIATYPNAIEAHLARMRLEHEGIPAFVLHEHHVWADWLMSSALQGVKVYVHPIDVADASQIIQAHDRGEFALEDDKPQSCPRCGGADVKRKRMSWKGALLSFFFAGVPLPFRWATVKCRQCQREWDLSDESEVQKYVVAFAAIGLLLTLAAAVTFLSYLFWQRLPWDTK